MVLTKKEAEKRFKKEVMPDILLKESFNKKKEKSARDLAWEKFLAKLSDNEDISQKQLDTWIKPRWL